MVGNVGGGGHLEFWTAAGWPSQGQHLTPCSICRVSRASQRSVCYGWCNRRYCSPHIHYKTKVSYSSLVQAHARQFSHLLFGLLLARMEPEKALQNFYWGKYLSSLFLLTNFFSQCVIIMEYKKAISCSTQTKCRKPQTVYLGLTQTFPLIDKMTIYEWEKSKIFPTSANSYYVNTLVTLSEYVSIFPES